MNGKIVSSRHDMTRPGQGPAAVASWTPIIICLGDERRFGVKTLGFFSYPRRDLPEIWGSHEALVWPGLTVQRQIKKAKISPFKKVNSFFPVTVTHHVPSWWI